MSLSNYALTTLAAASDYIGGTPQVNGIWIYCPSPTGSTAATVTVAENSISLVITGGASAGTSTFDLTAAAYDTITELVAGINALTGKWVAGAMCNGSASSSDLIVTGALSCLGSANEITLRIADNYGLTELINRATDFIERYCGRRLMSRSYDRAQYVGRGYDKLILRDYPVSRVFRISEGETNSFSVTNTSAVSFATVEVTATKVRLNADGTVTEKTISDYATIADVVAVINTVSGWSAVQLAGATRKAYYTGSDGSTKVSELLPMPAQRCMSPNVAYVEMPDSDVSDYSLYLGGGDTERDAGMLYRVGGWTSGVTYYIDYVAGFSTAPACLEEACLMLVKYAKDKMSKDGVLQSETMADYSYNMGVMGNTFSKDMMEQIGMFRAVEF
jgi:hypothetical protein